MPDSSSLKRNGSRRRNNLSLIHPKIIYRDLQADLNEPRGAGEFVRTDVTEDASIAALADSVLGHAGVPAVLVNAAGWDRSEPFLENSLEFVERIVRINLLGCVKVTRAFLPASAARSSP